MNINDFVILPGSKSGTSVRLKAKSVRELQLEKAQLETENKELEKKLQQLQSNMSREKEERKKSSPYHWKSGRAGPMTIHARDLQQSKENNTKTRVGKLEVVNGFIKAVNLNELKTDHEQQKVTSKHQVTPAKFPSLLASAGSAEELSSEQTCAGLGNQDKGSLLNGTFNEEESAKCFQEALLQWRKGNCDHREQLCAREILPESLGICEVQTNLTVTKGRVQIEFKKDGLSYMEKLLLKKYRRTPVDQISGTVRPVETQSVHQAVIEEEGEDDDIDDLTVEEVKRYWTSVFRGDIPNTVSERAESSLKIEFLDDSYDKDLEESSNFLVMEAGTMGMNEQGKAEPLKQIGRNPVSSKEISQGKMVERNAVQKESVKLKTMRRSLSSCKLPEKISNPTELTGSKYLLEIQLQKNSKDSQELDSVCNNQSLVLPLQDVAKRQKSVSRQSWGLEGFFVVGVNPKQVMLEACSSSLCAASSPVGSSIPFPGDGKWVTERSLSEYAVDSVVQGVLESQLNQSPSCGLETLSRISPFTAAWKSYPGNDSRRPTNCPTNTQPRPKSSCMHTCRVDTEISKHKCLDITTPDEYLWEHIADQEALLTLEKELESYTGPEKPYSLTSEDVTSSSRHSEKIGRNTTDFHENLKPKDYSRADALRGWDESQVDDEEEILEDKLQVLALH